MDRTPKRRFDPHWTAGNLSCLIVVCLAGAGLLALRAFGGRCELGIAPSVDVQRVAAVQEKVNPNTACAASLRRLPGLGPVRVRSIMNYRRRHGGAPFGKGEDLENVEGIGPGTVQRVREYLEFPPAR
ncbi:MAG TPA: helix-hairpin-helix domain-containing protein [Phycisphaerae bacterium]|nr:helix-hairpin-helix domain-containing protein [Phycisphaerae bacterium]